MRWLNSFELPIPVATRTRLLGYDRRRVRFVVLPNVNGWQMTFGSGSPSFFNEANVSASLKVFKCEDYGLLLHGPVYIESSMGGDVFVWEELVQGV